MSRKRIEIASEYRFGHTEIFPMSILLGGSIFWLPGNLLRYAGPRLVIGFLMTILLALVMIGSTNSLSNRAEKSLWESLTETGGEVFGSYCECLRLLALGSSVILETVVLGMLLQSLFQSLALWQSTLAVGLFWTVLILIKKENIFFHTHSFLTFLGIVSILAFSLTLLGRHFVYLFMGNGIYAVNDFTLDYLFNGKWQTIIPILITLFGGIEDGKDFFIAGSGETAVKENTRYTTMYRITLLYFLTILALSLSLPGSEMYSDGITFLLPLRLAAGKRILTVFLEIVIISVGLSNIASRLHLLNEHISVVTGIPKYWVLFLPLLAVIPVSLVRKNVFRHLFAIAGLLYVSVWCIILFAGIVFAVQEKKKIKLTLRVMALGILISCVLQYSITEGSLIGFSAVGMIFLAAGMYFQKMIRKKNNRRMQGFL